MDTIKVGLSINVIKGYTVESEGKSASAVQSCQVIKSIIESQLNSIYNPAGIEFSVAKCSDVQASIPKRPVYTSDVRAIEQLFSTKKLYIKGLINIFFVPILSDDTNAYQLDDSSNFIVISERDPSDWTQFSDSDIAKLLAHELGHELGLKNHNPDVRNLMYWLGPNGIDLNDNQINSMRRRAGSSVYSNVYSSKKLKALKCTDILSNKSAVRSCDFTPRVQR